MAKPVSNILKIDILENKFIFCFKLAIPVRKLTKGLFLLRRASLLKIVVLPNVKYVFLSIKFFMLSTFKYAIKICKMLDL